MISQGLSAADQRAQRAAMLVPNRVRTRLSARTLAGDTMADLSPFFESGQVNVDGSADVTRSLTLTLNDPRRALPFDTDHPAKTALFFDRAIRVDYEVLVAGDWQSIPSFTGPVTKLDRDGDQVTVECQGKEVLYLGAAWRPITLHKGMKKTDAIRLLLSDANPAYAETQLDIPDLPARMPRTKSLTREDVPWLVAQKIADSMSMQLFYDGRGTCRLRHRPEHVSLSFAGTGFVVSPIQVSWSDTFVNAVIVHGTKPKGAKEHVHAVAVAQANHPLSPQRTGRYLLPGGQIIRDDHIKTTAEAQKRADKRLADGLRQGVDVAFDSIPGPVALLDPDDLSHVHTDDGSVTFRIRSFSLPLVVGEPASVGYHRPVSMRKVHRRRRFDHSGPTKPRRKR